jgi:hypothetical protein
VLVLEIERAAARARLDGRRIDPEVPGAVYHAETDPPPRRVAGRVVWHADDTPERFIRRLAEFTEGVGPMLAALAEADAAEQRRREKPSWSAFFGGSSEPSSKPSAEKPPMLMRVDASRSPNAVYHDVRQPVVARVWASWEGERTHDGVTAYRTFEPQTIEEPAEEEGSKGSILGGCVAAISTSATAASDAITSRMRDGDDVRPQPVAFLIHGIGSFSHQWGRLGPALAEGTGMRVWVYDLLGNPAPRAYLRP